MTSVGRLSQRDRLRREAHRARSLAGFAQRVMQRRVAGDENPAAEPVRLDRKPMTFLVLTDKKLMRHRAYGNHRRLRAFDTHVQTAVTDASRASRRLR